MKEAVKSYFYFSKTERRGVIILLFLMILSFTAPRVVALLLPPEQDSFLEFEIKKFDDETNELSSTDSLNRKAYYNTYPPYADEKYRKQEYSTGKKETPKVNHMVELNSIDSLSLIELKGIGPAFAHRIIQYRQKLGGYIHAEQLLEVYGFDRDKYSAIAAWIQVDPVKVRKINVNDASFKEIMKHPYSSYQVAKALCNFRTRYGKITSIEDIRKSSVLADTTLEKLSPYLSFF